MKIVKRKGEHLDRRGQFESINKTVITADAADINVPDSIKWLQETLGGEVGKFEGTGWRCRYASLIGVMVYSFDEEDEAMLFILRWS